MLRRRGRPWGPRGGCERAPEVSRTVGLQIIVLDHANLDNEEFQEAIIEGGPWRDGNALIPESWL